MTTNTHYTAQPEKSGKPEGAWNVRDWNGMRIVWDVNDAEARRQAYSLNMTGHLTLPVRVAFPDRWQDAWFYKYAEPRPAPAVATSHGAPE